MTNPELNEPTALIEQLSAAATTVDAEDLPALAKMHGWSLALADIDGVDDKCVTELTEILEELILGTTENPRAALARMNELLGLLQQSSLDVTPVASDEPDATAVTDVNDRVESPGPGPDDQVQQLLDQLTEACPERRSARSHTACQHAYMVRAT